jgi:formamidopyrimidine-DNA glycosylase
MPELPSVEIFKQYFDKTSILLNIKDVKVTSPEILVDVEGEEIVKALKSHEFTGSYRYGKYLFCKLDNEMFLIMHFGMTGYLHYGNNQDKSKHPRLEIYFENGNHLAFDDARKFGKLSLTSHPEDFIKAHKLGPDALFITQNEFKEIFHGRKGMIKPLLLNQHVIAGIGNLYADEILYQSGVHPMTTANKLNDKEINLLFKNNKKVLEKAIEYQDKTLSLPSSYLLPHRHYGGECPEGGDLEIIKVGGRTTFFCPQRQKLKI